MPELPSGAKHSVANEMTCIKKTSHVGAPKIFALTLACQQINEAFGSFGCYHVGSSLERPDWRDVDVRFIMPDEKFAELFPRSGPWWIKHKSAVWEFDPRWLLMTTSISEHLSRVTGLPIDFQFQPQSHANEHHKGQRQALGMKVGEVEDHDELDADKTI